MVKTAFLSIHAAVVGSNLRNSSQLAQLTETEGRRIVSEFFSEQMFSALICLSLLPWSILALKEKSGRVILAELNSFPSHVMNNNTGFEDPSFSKCDHAGRHSSKEILRIGMFRTPEPLIKTSKDHSPLSLDNLLTHCNSNIRSCLKGSDATIISTLLHVKNTNTVSRDNQLIYIMNALV